MSIALQLLATIMLASFTFALCAMVYDATSKRGLSDRAARVISVLYLWPVAIVGVALFTAVIAAIWGMLP